MIVPLAREASALFSTAVFRQVLDGRSATRADMAICKLRRALSSAGRTTNQEIVNEAYNLLRNCYRTEYFYRNLIASKLFVGRHRASNSALLNEFRIGDSVADCVLVNGHGTVYEIKTEFDNPSKLQSQLRDYYRVFSLVNIVAHSKDRDRYLELLKGSPAGLVTVGTRDRLTIAKAPTPDTSLLNIKAMYNTLRVSESTKLLEGHFGAIPEVPNGLRYNHHLRLAELIEPQDFQKMMQATLKERGLRNSRNLILEPSLTPLRGVVSQLDPTLEQEEHLRRWLKSKG